MTTIVKVAKNNCCANLEDDFVFRRRDRFRVIDFFPIFLSCIYSAATLPTKTSYSLKPPSIFVYLKNRFTPVRKR